jgi:hypothetical protein
MPKLCIIDHNQVREVANGAEAIYYYLEATMPRGKNCMIHPHAPEQVEAVLDQSSEQEQDD